VLDVLAALRRQHMDVRLVVVGELSPQDRYHTSISDRIVRDGLKPYIEITGHLAPVDVADLLAVADACILPFRDGVHNVFYAQPGDIRAMSEAVVRFGKRKIYGKYASDWSFVADEHLQLYTRLCLGS
jgi:hypothetical protein